MHPLDITCKWLWYFSTKCVSNLVSASKSQGAVDITCKCPSRSRESSVAWLLRLSPVLLLSEQVDVDGGAPVGRLQFPRALSPIEALQEVNVLRVRHLPWRPCNGRDSLVPSHELVPPDKESRHKDAWIPFSVSMPCLISLCSTV